MEDAGFIMGCWLWLTAAYVTWWGMLSLFVLTYFFVYEEVKGWPLVTMALLSGSLMVTLNMSWQVNALIGTLYIPVGIIWSRYRWVRFSRTAMEEKGDLSQLSTLELNRLRRKISFSENISRIAEWILVWPFSMLNNVLSDLLDLLKQVIKDHLVGMYTRATAGDIKEIERLQSIAEGEAQPGD